MRTALAFCCAVALFCLIYPVYVIRPFRAQGADELSVALVVRSWAPLVATLAAVIAVALAVRLWTRRQRAIGSLLALCTVAAAAFTRVNIYEMMFHRIDATQSVRASEAKVDADDMVLAVKLGGQSRAYPVRMMAYHHIANDSLGGTALVATY